MGWKAMYFINNLFVIIKQNYKIRFTNKPEEILIESSFCGLILILMTNVNKPVLSAYSHGFLWLMLFCQDIVNLQEGETESIFCKLWPSDNLSKKSDQIIVFRFKHYYSPLKLKVIEMFLHCKILCPQSLP